MIVALLHATVILRLLLSDHETLTPAAVELFQRAEAGEMNLVLTPLIVAECCYVLRGPAYRLKRSAITDSLTQVVLLDGVVTEEAAVVLGALRRFGERVVDFADAYLAERAPTNAGGRWPLSTGILGLGGPGPTE